MARKSSSSSAMQSNGHAHPPTTEVGDSTKRLVSGTKREDTADEFDWDSPQYAVRSRPVPYDPTLLPKGSRSLSSISIQAFSLGFTLALCFTTTALLVKEGKPIWRLPTFFASLSLFHFLEFWTTARFNIPAVRASSFLLNNGTAYNFAHTLAALEIVVSAFIPYYQTLFASPYSITVGLVLTIGGQIVRSVAMAEAGTNFNHTPQKTKREGHELVTTGIYSYLRHPSYFAFFYWALGTQILVGNKICFLGFMFALWNFFNRRIRAEELTLVDFFGNDYEEFRKRTGTGIPFIR